MNKHILPPAILLLLTLAFLAAPAVTPPFMGYLPGQLPVDVGRPAIQPAGYAFSIWGVIYLWLITHAAFGLLKRQGNAEWAAPRPALTIALALGTVWLAIAASWPIAATISITVMAVAALTAFLKANPAIDRWLLIAPLAIFSGWLTAATLVSVGVIIAGYGWLTNEAAAYAMLATAAVLGLTLQSRQPSMPVYGATLVWALVAVTLVNSMDQQGVAIASAIAAGLTAVGTAGLWWRSRKS